MQEGLRFEDTPVQDVSKVLTPPTMSTVQDVVPLYNLVPPIRQWQSVVPDIAIITGLYCTLIEAQRKSHEGKIPALLLVGQVGASALPKC